MASHTSKLTVALLLTALFPWSTTAFSAHPNNNRGQQSIIAVQNRGLDANTEVEQEEGSSVLQRRKFMQSALMTTGALFTTSLSQPAHAVVPDVNTAPVEMKTFIDPKGLFAIKVPKRFFAIRRTVKGDLPDEETGKGRRGSSIFTAGDLSKAEVIAIERFPTAVMLQEEGISPVGDLSTFTAIGNPKAIASIIANRRDKDKQGQTRTVLLPDSVRLSEDEKTLYFQLSTDIDVQKPELLLEQTGVSELVRITLAKATLNSKDGQLMAVFASALQQDFAGSDGTALAESVESFIAVDQSLK